MKFLSKKRPAFTLVELLVVVFIITILVTIATASFNQAQIAGRNGKRAADLQLMATALELYYQDHGFYPMTHNVGSAPSFQSTTEIPNQEVISCLLGSPTAETVVKAPPEHLFKCTSNEFSTPIPIPGPYKKYLPKIPVDPRMKGLNELSYIYNSDGQNFILMTQAYEGTAPTDHLLNDPSCTQPYCQDLISWVSSNPNYANVAYWNVQYVVTSKEN